MNNTNIIVTDSIEQFITNRDLYSLYKYEKRNTDCLLDYQSFINYHKNYESLLKELLENDKPLKKISLIKEFFTSAFFKEQRIKVLSEIITNDFIADRNPYLSNYRRYLTKLAFDLKIDSKVFQDCISVFDEIPLELSEIAIFANTIMYDGLLNRELKNSSFDNVINEVLINTFYSTFSEKLHFLDLFLNLNSDISTNFFFYSSLILKISLKLSPAVAASLIVKYSNNPNLVQDFKEKLMNKINIVENFKNMQSSYFSQVTNYFDLNRKNLIVGGVTIGSLGLGVLLYDKSRKASNSMLLSSSQKWILLQQYVKTFFGGAGSIAGTAFGSFWQEFRRSIYDSTIRPMKEQIKDSVKFLIESIKDRSNTRRIKY